MHRIVRAALIGIAVFGLATPAGGDELHKRATAEFRRAGAELDAIEEGAGAEAVDAEVMLARKWIEDGFTLLKAGERDRAAALAERLPLQLTLIRAMLVVRELEIRAERVEQALIEADQLLSLLKLRYDRLIIERRGAAMTNAYPRPEKHE